MSFWNGTEWVADAPPAPKSASRAKRVAAAALEASLVTGLTFGLIAGSVFAAKGGNGGRHGGDGSSSLAVAMVMDQNGDVAPNWKDQVTFDVATTATDKPWVRLNCYQAGTWVSTMTHGFFEAYPWDPDYTLASGGWTSGAADCIATLYKVTSNGRSRTLATLGFQVAP
jgi:hypothetical protein